ncbi:MAG: inositol monophosphatase, partial [Candidatus Omnitrophica bacterium]|nr:inositol monophosphatase [Candidatus Omnitrophota bacterium]
TVRSLTYLAEGKADIEIEFNDKAWDFAAGLLLVEEAGGKSTDFRGRRWNTDTRGYIASNAVVHEQLLRIMKRGLKK